MNQSHKQLKQQDLLLLFHSVKKETMPILEYLERKIFENFENVSLEGGNNK